MLLSMTRNWQALVVRGAIAILFSLLAFLMPGVTIFVLITLFGVYALIDGVINLVAAFRTGIRDHWPLLVEGIVGIAAGILTMVWPHITALILIYLIAFWAIFTGVFEIVAAFRLWRVVGHEWILLLSGIVSLVFGFLIVSAPAAGALAIVVWIAAYAMLFGVLLISYGLRLRQRHGRIHATPTSQPA